MTAQDTVQDVFVKMLELDIMIPPDKLRAWMYKVALRNYIDSYRRDLKYSEILSELAHYAPDVIQGEEKLDMAPFLAQLKPYEAELVRKYYYEELSIKELSELTGYSPSKIKTDLYRARKKLKKILEKEEDGSSWLI